MNKSYRPILFRDAMVRAILAGIKTQTRRVIKPQPVQDGVGWTWPPTGEYFQDDDAMAAELYHEFYGTRGTPYGSVWADGGDRLWVREAWTTTVAEKNGLSVVAYRADGAAREMMCSDEGNGDPCGLGAHANPWPEAIAAARWKSAIFMPRWASRITLELTGVRVQRVQSISEADARAEGVGGVDEFASLWDAINGKKSPWASDPWVWALTFKQVEVWP